GVRQAPLSIMAAFTMRGNRAGTRRGFVVMGKNALIRNEFPRATQGLSECSQEHERFNHKEQVRASCADVLCWSNSTLLHT
ncbi:MAG TPA: hypothetical protein VHN77_12560, partial [Phycisphaerales bacterium]|nr:hypothetical protein [Phycisphaerales bacterium]